VQAVISLTTIEWERLSVAIVDWLFVIIYSMKALNGGLLRDKKNRREVVWALQVPFLFMIKDCPL
jgi:hypothetical protein